MKTIALITSVDYELFGDGSGDVTREQIDRITYLEQIVNQYGVKLTIMFEYGQFLAYEKFAVKNRKFTEDNEKIKEQLISLIKMGHDVQLHYHAQWENAIYDELTNSFDVNIKTIDISSLPYNIIVKRLKDGKFFLEDLLKPYKKDYRCIGFRAGSWAVQDQKKLLSALIETGFKSDTSVVPNTQFDSEQVKFNYKNCPSQYHYWFVNDTLERQGLSKLFVEIPIYTNKSFFAYLKYLNSKYFNSRRIVKKLYHIKVSEQNFSLYQKLKKVFSRNYYMADLNTMSAETLITMVEKVLNSNQFEDEDVIPIMFISHSKTSYALEDLHTFYSYLADKYSNRIEYWTYQETIDYIQKDRE